MRMNASIALLSIALISCGDDSRVAGNGTNIGNAQASGRIFTPSGTPAEGVWVECSPDSLAPWDARLPGWTSLTDSVGRYRCTDLPFGRVGVSAYDPASGRTRWRDDTLAQQSPVDSAFDTLATSGKLRVALPPGTSGILHFTGLTRSVSVHGEQELLIDDMPAGWFGSLLLARTTSSSITVDSGLYIKPGGVDSAAYSRTSSTLRITLPGGLTTMLSQLPLLVRLDSTWPGFAQALADGSDLRLSSIDGKALPITIASWNRQARTAELWTLIDSLQTPGESIDLILGWGIPVPAASPAKPFTTAKGWIAAWPLGDSGKTSIDLLGSFPGTNETTLPTAGVIATATRFDGKSTQITFPGSESNALAHAEGEQRTYSCWARLGTPSPNTFLMGHGRFGTGMYVQIAGGMTWWTGREYRSSPAGSDYHRALADTATWTHLAMTISGSTVSMYVNGVRASDSGFNNDPNGPKTLPFLIGSGIDTLGLTSTYGHFSGDIDEVWMQSVVRSADWIRFVAANQKSDAPRAQMLR